MFWIFIRINNRIAFAALNCDWGNFILELTRLLGCFSFLLTKGCELVLLFPCDLPFLCDILGGIAHVIAIKGIPQSVFDHRIDHRCIAHARARTKMHAVGRQAHVFLATRDNNLGITHLDRLKA